MTAAVRAREEMRQRRSACNRSSSGRRAWMVIVAGEMLAGGTGIGFFVWDSWNALSLERVISAILMIGLTGLVLDRLFGVLGQRMNAWQEGGH